MRTMRTIILVALSLCLAQSTHAQPQEEATKPIQDRDYYFEAAVPANWSIQQPQETSGILRLQAFSSDKTQAVYFYTIASKGEIDLEKFIALDRELGWELGPQIKEQRFGFIFTSSVERTYGPSTKGLHAAARFQIDETYGYIILALATADNLSFSRQIFDSFSSNVPYFANLKNKWEGFFTVEWLGSIIGVLLFIFFLYLLGKTGSRVRRGVETKKVLKQAAIKAAREGLTLSSRWYDDNKKSTRWIMVPILGWIMGYGLLFYILPIKLFLVTLFLLVPPILGYFGIFFVPTEDFEDYLP